MGYNGRSRVVCLFIALALFTFSVDSRNWKYSLRGGKSKRFHYGKPIDKVSTSIPAKVLVKSLSNRIDASLNRAIGSLQKVIEELVQSLVDDLPEPINLQSDLIDLESAGLIGLVGLFRDSILGNLNDQLQNLIAAREALLENLPFSRQLLAGAVSGDYTDSCAVWMKNDLLLPNFVQNISTCPCTLVEALIDTDNFIPDEGCTFGDPESCLFHPGAASCVISREPSESGGGQQCCYTELGEILEPEELGAGSSDRTSTLVDGVGHVLTDVAPFIYCCLWSDNCSIYKDLRPSKNACLTIPSSNAI